MIIETSTLIEKAIAKGLNIDKYMFIMDNVHKVNVSENEDFQRCYDSFYVVRRNNEWRNKYFSYFEDNKDNKKICFSEIITYLYETTGNIEASFSSKMLATINQDMPIWDQYVLKNLGLELVGKNNIEKLKNAILLYDEIVRWYKDYMSTDNCKECLDLYKHNLPKYSMISDIKKIDFLLWSNR